MKIVIKDGKLWTLDDDAKCTRLETTEQMRESIQNRRPRPGGITPCIGKYLYKPLYMYRYWRFTVLKLLQPLQQDMTVKFAGTKHVAAAETFLVKAGR